MTNKELPTAAILNFQERKLDETILPIEAGDFKKNSQVETVRRKKAEEKVASVAHTAYRTAYEQALEDVEQLIEDKIKEFNEGRPPEYPQKALKEVLDEVQNQ